MLRRGRSLLLALALLGAAGCSSGGDPGCGNPGDSVACTRILFVGNSYTFVNDLPGTFAQLARSGGHRVEVAMEATGGWALADHLGSSVTMARIGAEKWSDVVLQEQSEIPSIAQFRDAQMVPAARQLAQAVRNDGARVLFFDTWAHRDGWPENGLVGYGPMQAAIDGAYLSLASEQNAVAAPVGVAWSVVVGQEARPGLWQDDGSHPTTKGTYLAACVFYAVVYGQSPDGIAYHSDVPADEAAYIQKIAGGTVLGDPARWGLP